MHRPNMGRDTQMPLARKRCSVSCSKNAHSLEPPYGIEPYLLLTMDRCAVLQPQVGRLTCGNTSIDQHSQALDGLSRAPFATQSDTHFDLVSAGTDHHRIEPPEANSLISHAVGKFIVTVSVWQVLLQLVYRQLCPATPTWNAARVVRKRRVKVPLVTLASIGERMPTALHQTVTASIRDRL
jgi:hypothetical protein